MKRFVVAAGAAMVFLCTASAATAQRDAVERGTRMDTDAIRDDVRTNRLQVPEHPLFPGQQPQVAPNSKSKAKSKRSGQSN
jgi:hypothetical protein